MVARYVQLCEETDNPFGNSKYVIMQMLDGGGKTAAYKLFQQAKDYAALRAAAAACASEPHFCKPSRPPVHLEPAPDLPHAAALPVNLWRAIPPHCKAARLARAEIAQQGGAATGAAQDEQARGERGGGAGRDAVPAAAVPNECVLTATPPISGVKRQAPSEATGGECEAGVNGKEVDVMP